MSVKDWSLLMERLLAIRCPHPEDDFIYRILPLVEMRWDVGYDKHAKRYTIYNTYMGNIVHYARKNKSCICREGKWMNNGNKFIINLLFHSQYRK